MPVDCPTVLASLGLVGRAERFRTADPGVDVWRFASADAPVAERLVLLGGRHCGGFTESGVDAAGVWATRAGVSRTVRDLERGEQFDWARVLGIVHDVAQGLSICERLGLFAGPLVPQSVVFEPRVFVLADGLVRALVGADAEATDRASQSLSWWPPEQLAGGAWNNAANRYVLGLVAYRLLAGRLPFDKGGLRGVGIHKELGPPPFDESTARALPSGVQGFVLAMLAPNPSDRPARAELIAEACASFLEPRPVVEHSPPDARETHRKTGRSEDVIGAQNAFRATDRPVQNPTQRSAKRVNRWWTFAPVGLGVAIAALVFASSSSPEPTASPKIAPAHLTGLTAADCSGCHPRQVAEWQRSVMAHAAKSPLFGALESLIEEQVGRDSNCLAGAGILRRAGIDACRDERSGVVVTGSGGEHWCVNCHAGGDNLKSTVPAWERTSTGSHVPLTDTLTPLAKEGVSCAICHTTTGPVGSRQGRAVYEGNPSWTSFLTGALFKTRPEDAQGRFGISNSGYLLDAARFSSGSVGGVHGHSSSNYLRSSEFCGTCHDVRLFGTDVLGIRDRGEHFKRLRNGYTEWRIWAESERRSGRPSSSCADCHMSLYPGICAPGAGNEEGCPSGSHFERRDPGALAFAPASLTGAPHATATHFFTSVDIPLTPSFPEAFASDRTIDASGLPVGLRPRRDLLLRHTFRFGIANARRSGDTLEIPIVIENTGAGHRVPAGFSQEREIWVELTVKDARGGTVYEVGKLDDDSADLRDKIFTRVTTSDASVDERGRPIGLFGADVIDGPDVGAWIPNPARGGTRFRGKGLINLQNGFLRCVRCIGTIDRNGECQPAAGQGRTRADRFDDGVYDLDTGACRSNLSEGHELFETYFPVGALDASRGIAKAPDAIIDTRSAPPQVPLTYAYAIDAGRRPGPFTVTARLRFRSFPPFLVRAFAAYEARKASERLRPSGAQVTDAMLRRIEIVDLARAEARIE